MLQCNIAPGRRVALMAAPVFGSLVAMATDLSADAAEVLKDTAAQLTTAGVSTVPQILEVMDEGGAALLRLVYPDKVDFDDTVSAALDFWRAGLVRTVGLDSRKRACDPKLSDAAYAAEQEETKRRRLSEVPPGTGETSAPPTTP